MRHIWVVLLAAFLGAAWVKQGGPASAAPPDGKRAVLVGAPGDPGGDPDDRDGKAVSRQLTKKEINRIRYRELRNLRENNLQPDKARSSIPRDVLLTFLKDMQGREISDDWPGPDEFRRLGQEKKLAIITRLREDAYVDKIEITSDPVVFVEFKRKVLPAIIRGCATAHCHGGAEGEKTGLKLHDDARRSPEMVYTNFLLLDEIAINHGGGSTGQRYQMIDRGRPDESLLLAWMLAPDQLPANGPHHPGDVKVKPVFRSKTAPGYDQMAKWIASLRLPHPEYGVKLDTRSASSAPAVPRDKPAGR